MSDKREMTRVDKIAMAGLAAFVVALVAVIAIVWASSSSPSSVDPEASVADSSANDSVEQTDDALPALRHWTSDDPQWKSFISDVRGLEGPDRLTSDGLLGTAQGTCMTLDAGMGDERAADLLQVDDEPWSDSAATAWVSAAKRHLC